MRVVEASAFGAPDVLGEVERPDPQPEAGRVRVAVEARTLNAVDFWVRSGAFIEAFGDNPPPWLPDLKPPLTLGWDLAGVILDDGEGFVAGDRVLGMVQWFATPQHGTYADIVSVEPGWIAPLPEGVGSSAATTLPLNGLTAAQSLDLLGLQPGQSVLVGQASGGVGTFAVQLAKTAGLEVIAIAAEGDESFLTGIGADGVISRAPVEEVVRAVRELLPDGVNGVIDGATEGAPLLAAVADGGGFVTVNGEPPGPIRGIEVQRQIVNHDGVRLQALAEEMASGALQTRIAEVMPISEAPEAHRRGEAGGLRGKLVLSS
jgi:NADPH:quinone reductase-like Zn-dependent oxidoreductase